MAVPTTPHHDPEVLVIGTPFVDVVLGELPRWPAPGEEVWAQQRTVTAGGVANNAVTLARLGRTTRLAGIIGNDPLGDLLIRLLEAEDHLKLDSLQRREGLETPFTLAVGDSGDRAFISHGDMATWSPAADERVGIPAAVFLTLNQEPVRWLADLRSQGSMIVAGLAFDEHNGWDPSVLDSLVDIDILVCNATEAMAYTRTPDVEQALTALAQRAPLVVVTMGADGAIARGRLPGDRGDVAGVQHQPAVPAQAVDATGAGDSYVSALIDAALRPDASLTECLKHASLVAAFVVAGRGGAASAPTPQQLLRRAQQLGATFDFERTWSTLRSSRSL